MGDLNPKFEKYASGFSEVYKDYFGKEPTMGDYTFNGWLDVKDIPDLNFEEMGKIHAKKVIEEQEARDLLSAINCYLLCDFGVQDVEMQAQAAAEKERILKIQEKLKKIVGE